MRYQKPAISLSEQIDQLRSRGLTIEDTSFAEHFLSYVSYYRLAGYWWPLQADKEHHHFKDGSRFETVIDLYNFDRELRAISFDMIERIEIGIRTLLIYHLSLAYGPFWFEDDQFFKVKELHERHLRSIRKEVKRSKEVFITEHQRKYDSDTRCPPAWKSLEIVSLGLLSKLYENLRNGLLEKKQIARQLGVGGHVYLSSWLRSISIVRNICAHHSRLWNRNLSTPPRLLKQASLPWVDSVQIDKHSVYYVFCCMYYLLQTISPGNHIRSRIEELLAKYPTVDPIAMGFKTGWREQPLWKN